MDDQVPAISDSQRTNWTPPMDRYFIDLLLDQVHKGNKIGHAFSKQAWMYMITLFNKKFGFQYENHVLKNRHKTFRKQYNNIKILLDQSGFGWDKTKQMVTADDHIWDDYIKAHPDARQYRTKIMPYYADFCLIFGNSVADGRYYHSGLDLDHDNEGERLNSQAPNCNGSSKTNCIPPMDCYLIDLMLDQARRGNMIGLAFKKKAWTRMTAFFNAKFGLQYSKKFLRYRCKNLRKQYNAIKNILDQSGFCWDEKQQMVTADDHVWDDYIKANPDAQLYRTKIVPYYNDLCMIYGNAPADGRSNNLLHDVDLDDGGKGMGSQSPTSSDHLRTNWMPTMDCYLIDLMVDEALKGNRIGHAFKKKAWTRMTTLFNTKFGLQCNKKLLGQQCQNLREQYNAIKNLISLNEFHWDETQQMVVADDCVWDDYIKAHPDMQPYRTKIVPYYIDLCVVYGTAATGGRYNHSGYSVDFDEGNGMHSQSPMGSDHSKTNWTPEMDRYLVDLLLEEVHRGNRIGHAFKKNAWTRMVTLFNAKFTLHYTKNVLVYRYRNLRKQYNAIKILLDQSGFDWDEKQQMVTADDCVWDDYIKAHPDAQQYRTETLSYYIDLCVIYGDATADGRYNCSGHDVNLNNQGKGMDSQAPTFSDRSRTNWTPPMDRYFVDLLLDQVHKENNIGHTFSKEAWTHMIKLFNTKFGFHCDKVILKNRYKTLRKQYYDMKILLDQSGFSWDNSLQMVTADDYVWEDYIKAHPDARVYRTKFMPYYNDLCMICGNATADGGYNQLSQDVDLDNDFPGMKIGGVLEGLQAPATYVSYRDVVNNVQDDSSLSGANMDIINRNHKRRSTTPLTSQHSRKLQNRTDEGMQDALREMAAAVTSLANKKKENDTSISVENVIDVLQNVPGIDEDLILDACDYLEDDKKARTFLALDITLRKKWLMRKLRTQ